jgi:hypothetical protein
MTTSQQETKPSNNGTRHRGRWVLLGGLFVALVVALIVVLSYTGGGSGGGGY